MNQLEGKVLAVTGIASGLGKGIAELFHAQGAKVVGLDLNPIPADMTGKCIALQGDVTVEADIERLVATAVKEFGRLDIMVNCAGGSRHGSVLDIASEDFEFTVKLCLFSVLYGIKHAGRQMRAQGDGGRIITISSHSGQIAEEWMSPYCASKAAVNQLIRCAALELGPFGITVNGIAPGFTDTPIIEAYTSNPDIVAEICKKTPMRRVGRVEDITQYALFLAGAESSYINGTVQIIDGGQFLEGYPNVMDLIMKGYKVPFPFPETVKEL